MALTLITGPANAAKVGEVIGRLRAALHRQPIFVVPTSADVTHYQRELAAAEVVFGVEVSTFARLIDTIAGATGVKRRPIGPLVREHVIRAAIDDVELELLRRPAAGPGFSTALGIFFADLQRSFVSEGGFLEGLQAWSKAEPREAPAYVSELAELYTAYRRRLQRCDWVDRDGYAWMVLDRLRAEPNKWPMRPVFFYGFDDLTSTQLDTVVALVERVGTEVCVALPYEAGRAAFAGSASTVESLKPLAEKHIELSERSDYYSSPSRDSLHHLERGLFECKQSIECGEGAVRLLEAGGIRAEAEIVGAEVLELLRQGVEPEQIAILVRESDVATLFEQVLTGYGVPVDHHRSLQLGKTALGAGVLACARAASPTGTASDLLTWLRTPGKIADIEQVDRLEASLTRGRLTGVKVARTIWEEELGQEQLTTLDRLSVAITEKAGGQIVELLQEEAAQIWAGSARRSAKVFTGFERDDARVVTALGSVSKDFQSIMRVDSSLVGSASMLLESIAAIDVVCDSNIAGVLITNPLQIRARRFRAIFVCGLQEGKFPKEVKPNPFLDRSQRNALARATGLILPTENFEARERYLFYACVSRPQEALFLSWCSSDDEGSPLQRSPFIDEVRALFTEELWDRRGRRLLADVTWPPNSAPTPHELQRSLAAAESAFDPLPLDAPRSSELLDRLAQRNKVSARELETFANCGVKWLIESLLRPKRFEPDTDPMWRGALSHRLLERVFESLRTRVGSARITPSSLHLALEELELALIDERQRRRSPSELVVLRALEIDLRRFLHSEAQHDTGFEPSYLEWGFGGEKDSIGPLQLDVDQVSPPINVTGRVDRVDVKSVTKSAIVRDYKGRTVHPASTWVQERRLQVPIYMLAVQQLLQLDPAGGLYQPLGKKDTRARGIVRDGVPGGYVRTDTMEDEVFDATMSALSELIAQSGREMQAGKVQPCPSRCGPNGCSYPVICRANGSTVVDSENEVDNGSSHGG